MNLQIHILVNFFVEPSEPSPRCIKENEKNGRPALRCFWFIPVTKVWTLNQDYIPKFSPSRDERPPEGSAIPIPMVLRCDYNEVPV